MHIFRNQSTHSQRRQKITHNRNPWESRTNFPHCYVIGMFQHVKGRQWRGASKAALHISFQQWVVFLLLALQKCGLSSFSMRAFMTLSSLLISSFQAHLLQELLGDIFSWVLYKSVMKNYSEKAFDCWRLHTVLMQLAFLYPFSH